MILFFYGEDTFRSTDEVKKLKERFVNKGKNINLIEFDTESESFAALQNILQSLPLFSPLRFVVVKNALHNLTDKEKEKLLPLLQREEENKDLVVCFQEKGKLDKSELGVWLAQRKHAKEFLPLNPQQLKAFLMDWTQQNAISIEGSALQELQRRFPGDLWKLTRELQKLSTFTNGEVVQRMHVDLLTENTISSNIFQTIDAVARRNRKEALRLLHQHLKNGENELSILGMLQYQFRNLLQVSELVQEGKSPQEIAKIAKIHPFAVEKALGFLRGYPHEQLLVIFQKLADLDARIKTGKIEPGVALDLLVVGLTV